MFQLSVKSKYGLAAVIELAQKQEKGPIQIKAISCNRNIPQNYLEQVLVELKKGGLVRSFRGINGGYQLEKDPKTISVKDVLTILEGPCKLTGTNCDCPLLNQFWEKTEAKIDSYLSVSIADILNLKLVKNDNLSFNI